MDWCYKILLFASLIGSILDHVTCAPSGSGFSGMSSASGSAFYSSVTDGFIEYINISVETPTYISGTPGFYKMERFNITVDIYLNSSWAYDWTWNMPVLLYIEIPSSYYVEGYTCDHYLYNGTGIDCGYSSTRIYDYYFDVSGSDIEFSFGENITFVAGDLAYNGISGGYAVIDLGGIGFASEYIFDEPGMYSI